MEPQEGFSKENQKHINPKRFKARRNYNSFHRVSKGSRYNSNQGNFHGTAGQGCRNYSTKNKSPDIPFCHDFSTPEFRLTSVTDDLNLLKTPENFNQSIIGGIRRGSRCLAYPTAPLPASRLASLHAGSLPIPSNSQQEASTCRSQEFCGHPLGLLQ